MEFTESFFDNIPLILVSFMVKFQFEYTIDI